MGQILPPDVNVVVLRYEKPTGSPAVADCTRMEWRFPEVTVNRFRPYASVPAKESAFAVWKTYIQVDGYLRWRVFGTDQSGTNVVQDHRIFFSLPVEHQLNVTVAAIKLMIKKSWQTVAGTKLINFSATVMKIGKFRSMMQLVESAYTNGCASDSQIKGIISDAAHRLRLEAQTPSRNFNLLDGSNLADLTV